MGFSIQDLFGLVIAAALIATPIILWKRKKKIAAVAFGVVITLLWIVIALPGLKKARTFAPRAACINNLEVIQRVKDEWAKQNNKQGSDSPLEMDLVGTNKPLSEMPKCPAGGIITIGPVNQRPVCSIAGHVISDGER